MDLNSHLEYCPICRRGRSERRRRLSTIVQLVLTQPQWKVLVVDEDSKKLIDNVTKDEDILNLNVTSMQSS